MYQHSITWNQFKTDLLNLVQQNLKTKLSIDNFLFRGQASRAWHLSSSFDRLEKDKSKYQSLLNNFEAICKKYNYNEELFALKPEERSTIAAYAQHYGLPTRLVDWTKSPYYAAFFAFSEINFDYKAHKSVTIWAINQMSQALKRRGGIEFVDIASNKFNYRMRNQIGHFTLSQHLEDSIEDFEDNLLAQTGINDLLWRFDVEIPPDPNVILEDLNLMGINFSTVYPDIFGFIKQAVFESKLGN